jgi:regulator of RNase E activity RraB
MSRDWDFYFCRVDDKPASVFVDLGVVQEVVAKFPHMAYMRVYLRIPRPDGLSSREEFESLTAIEGALESPLTSSKTTVYIGRNTSDGCRDFYCYTNKPQDWGRFVDSLMRSFPGYEFDYDTREDPEWKTYFGFLYPSEEDRERIQNRRTCESLEKNGDTLDRAREIDHWIYFCDENLASCFFQKASELGFRERTRSKQEGEEEKYIVQIFRIDTPSFDNIDSVTLPLFRLAKEYGGSYDGWETQVVS